MGGDLNKHESKYFNCACLMDEALILLLEKKEFAYITVKEICQKAGVNRSTFYLHYESMADLLSETLAYTNRKFEQKFAERSAASGESIEPLSDLVLISPKYIIPYLEYLRENKKLYMAAMSQDRVFGVEDYYKRVYNDIITPVLKKMNVPEQDRKYLLAFYVSGLHSLVFEWVKGGCVEDTEYICGLMMRFANDRNGADA